MCLQWDLGVEYKKPPVILDGGYERFLDMYPVLTTNANIERPIVVNTDDSMNSETSLLSEYWYTCQHFFTSHEILNELQQIIKRNLDNLYVICCKNLELVIICAKAHMYSVSLYFTVAVRSSTDSYSNYRKRSLLHYECTQLL